MTTVKLKQSLVSGLAILLENVAPSKLATLKQMRLAQKSADKFIEGSKEFTDAHKVILDMVTEKNREMKDATDEDKRAIEIQTNKEITPFITKRDEIGETETKIELSDEELEFLKSNYKEVIANNFKTVKHALEVADALGIEE